jgi:SAM-dependent methyltransferase
MLGGVSTPGELRAAPARERSSFRRDRLQRIAQLEQTHFWFVGRRALVQRLLDRHVDGRADAALDLGCGTGSFLDVLGGYADNVVGVDPLAPARDERVLNAEAEQLPLEDSSVDLIVALDVFEHVDDCAALRECARVLHLGGLLVLTVPAFPALWSARDVLAAHRRRYRRKPFVALLERSGFLIEETSYYQFFLFPLIAASRLAGRRRATMTQREEVLPPRLNALLRRLNETEVRLGRRVRWPWGSTLAVAARRTDEPSL